MLSVTFPNCRNPDDTRGRFQNKVFSAIGGAALITPEALEIVQLAARDGKRASNVRPYRTSVTSWEGGANTDFDWLKEQGANIDALQNANILRLTSVCDISARGEESTHDKLTDIQSLRIALQDPSSPLDPMVSAYGWERLSSAVAVATRSKEVIKAISPEERAIFESILPEIITAASPENAVKQNALTRAREDSARAILNLARINTELTVRYRSTIETLAADDLSNVRSAIAYQIGYLWDTDRELVLKLAEQFVVEEKHGSVLLGVLNFLIRAVNEAPDRVGKLVQLLLLRRDVNEDNARKVVQQALGTLVFHLWVRHRQDTARKIIDGWLTNRAAREVELQRGVFSIRDGLVLGYDSAELVDAQTRANTQALAFEIIDVCAIGIESYLALPVAEQTEEKQEQASKDAKLLDNMASQFLFAVGATEIREKREPKAVSEVHQQRRYLADNEATFRRIGDVGTPHTIYYLIQLLEFLMATAPAKVFDLVAHALLVAGKLHNYHSESLGAIQFVRMIGHTIADHRDVFDDPDRRVKLVEVLEVFVNAGWPAASRLLYRLPEALR